MFPVSRGRQELYGYTGKSFWHGGRHWAHHVFKDARVWRRDVLWFSLIALGALGCIPLVCRDAAARRVLSFTPGLFAAYTVASFAAPYFYLPERYTAYTIPLLTTLLVSCGIANLSLWLPSSCTRHWQRTAGALTAIFVCGGSIVLLGGRGSATAGLPEEIRDEYKPVYRFARSTPPDSVFAGWPHGFPPTPVTYLPLVTHRSVLVSEETHQAFHAAYAIEMRKRTVALVAAYFATSAEPLKRLRDEFGVDYLIYDTRDREQPPTHFLPFSLLIDETLKTSDKSARSRWLDALKKAGAIHSRLPYLIVDLHKIPERG
jgi:hypothetical protein